MSASNAFETAILALVFTNANFPFIGDATGLRGSTVAGNYYISLHTADPGEAGTQATTEVAYTSYARIAITRTAGAWTLATNTARNTSPITFPTCTGGSSTAVAFGIGTDLSGAGNLLFSGLLDSSLAISNNIAPTIPALGMTVTAD